MQAAEALYCNNSPDLLDIGGNTFVTIASLSFWLQFFQLILHHLQIAEAISRNNSLELLDIGGNNIGPEGIKVLLSSLKGNMTLKTLELGYNPIGEEGAKALADVIKYDLGVS